MQKDQFLGEGTIRAPDDQQIDDDQIDDNQFDDEQIDDAVRTVLADLSPDRISDLASSLGLRPEQVQAVVTGADFERMVAEEAARLVGEGASND